MYTCSQARRKLPYLHRLQKSEQRDQDRHFSYPKKGWLNRQSWKSSDKYQGQG